MVEIKNKRNIGFLLVIITSLGYGLMPALTQRCYEAGMSVETVLSARYTIGTMLMWIFILIRRENLKVGKSNMIFLCVIGFVAFLCTVCMANSYLYLPGAVASLIVFSYIIIVNVFEIAIGKEKVYKSRILCLVLTAVGLVAVIYAPGEGVGFSVRGILLAFGAGVLYAVWTMGLGAKRLKDVNPLVITAIITSIPVICNITRSLIAHESIFPETGEQWKFLLMLASTAGFLSPVCFCIAVRLIGASTASIINTSEPVIAYIAGILIMADQISINATIGGIMIVMGILFLNISEKRRETRLSDPNI